MGTVTSIDLGDQNLLAAYLACARNALLSQTYSNLLEMQQKFSLEGMDVGLAVKFKAYQTEMLTYARAYDHQTMPAIIHQMTYASNFSALMSAFKKVLGKDGFLKLENIKDISVQVSSLKETAIKYEIYASALNAKMGVTWNSLQPLADNFKTVIDQIESNLTVAAQNVSQEISDLNALIDQNIQGIIDGGEKAGSGVVEIGNTIITTLNVSEEDESKLKKDQKSSDKDESDKAKAKKEDDELPTKYLVSGLNAIAGGIAGSSQAAADLKLNNEKLAAAYQKLAKVNSLLSVAKSIEAQNELFVSSIQNTNPAITQLDDGWKKVTASFSNAENAIFTINSAEELQSLKSAVEQGAQKWKILSDQIDDIKLNYANVSGASLPLAS